MDPVFLLLISCPTLHEGSVDSDSHATVHCELSVWEDMFLIPQTSVVPLFLTMSCFWKGGISPPPAMVALISVSSSSSPLVPSCKCLGVIIFLLGSLLALSTSGVRYGVLFLLVVAVCGHPGQQTHPGRLFVGIPLSPDGPYAVVSPNPYSDAWVHVIVPISWSCQSVIFGQLWDHAFHN